MKREDKIADALAEKLVDSFGGKAIEVIEILISLEKVIQRKERLAFAERLILLREKIREHSYEDGLLTVIELEIDDMIKELRSNPLQRQSVDGNERSEKK